MLFLFRLMFFGHLGHSLCGVFAQLAERSGPCFLARFPPLLADVFEEGPQSFDPGLPAHDGVLCASQDNRERSRTCPYFTNQAVKVHFSCRRVPPEQHDGVVWRREPTPHTARLGVCHDGFRNVRF